MFKRCLFLALTMVIISSITACTSHREQEAGTYVPTSPEITVTVILGTWSWDAESNKQGLFDETDFFWRQVTEKERYLEPVNGAKAKLISDSDFDKIDPDFIKRQNLSEERISGSNQGGRLSPGAIVMFKTAEGNLGKLQIEKYRALHDFSFPEAKYLSEDWKSFALGKPNNETYHLQVRWQLYR